MFRKNDLQVMQAGAPIQFEETAQTVSGMMTVVSTKFPLFTAEKRVFGLGGISTDITERRELEEALRIAKEGLEKRVQEPTEELEKSQEGLRNLAAHLESVREEERTAVSREVHDQLGQTLTALKIDLSRLDEKMGATPDPLVWNKTKELVGAMNRIVEQTIQSVRRIASSLRPGILDDFGLEAAIEWETQEFQKRTGIPCSLRRDLENFLLTPEQSTGVFRIFQEIMTNIVRHASAQRVEIFLRRQGGFFTLEVEDDGRGITPEEIRSPQSWGILGMSERARLMSGHLTISGNSSQGTRVSLKIPIFQQETL